MKRSKQRLPLWVSNLVVFGFLCVMVVTYFVWQMQASRQAFIDKMQTMAELVTRVIALHAQGAVLSRQTTEEILHTFLGNTARFIDYLDAVEPFNPRELTEFAKEARLSGISIIQEDGTRVEGPGQWLNDAVPVAAEEPRLDYSRKLHLYIFFWPRKEGAGLVVTGIEASNIESLQEQLGLPKVIEAIRNLPGISYIRTTPREPGEGMDITSSSLRMVGSGQATVAESAFFIDGQHITIGLDAAPLNESVRRLWRDFLVFSGALIGMGTLLSLLLYRQQSLHLEAIRAYERNISEQREEAALGRAAAAIAHEIRNPLNSLNMGLQRLRMEVNELTDEQRRFIEIMLDAVRRANTIVAGLLRYAAPLYTNPQPVRIDRLLETILPLYQTVCAQQGITIKTDVTCKEPIADDPGLLSQVLENLLKNALEAQPQGGFIAIEIKRDENDLNVAMTNGGFSLSPEQAERIGEPYFTTKQSGTGLGLAIARRIITAHGGRLQVKPQRGNTVTIQFQLPLVLHPDSYHTERLPGR